MDFPVWPLLHITGAPELEGAAMEHLHERPSAPSRDHFSRMRSKPVLIIIAALLLLPCSGGSASAAQAGELGDIQSYQEAFAAALRDMGTESPPSGPVWIQPEVLPEQEACTSCHLGTTDDRFLYARLPYRRHSGHFLEDHPPERFGCIACHGGVPDGSTFAAAGHPAPADITRRRQWEQHLGWRAPAEEQAESGRMVPLQWIAGRCTLCHQESELPRGAESYRESRALVAEKRCSACHVFRDEPQKNVRTATHLEHLGSKVGSAWLTRYLSDPHAFSSGMAMPAYAFQEGDVQALADFLLSRTDPAIGWKAEDPPGDGASAERGSELVRERRCQTCHDIPGIEDTGFIRQRLVGPSLARGGEKLNPEWIRRWIAEPSHWSETGMPQFRFDDVEARDTAVFLTSLRSQESLPASPASTAEPDRDRAAAVALKYGCAACHSIEGLELELPPRTDLRGVAPALLARQAGARPGELEGPEGIFHRTDTAPRLFAPGEGARGVMTFLAGQAQVPIPDAFRRPGPERGPEFSVDGLAGGLVKEKRCLSCHTIRGTGGDIGPELTYAGSKLQRDWLVSFLLKPVPIRPMNRAHMPVFGLTQQEAETLADWIGSDLKSPMIEELRPDLESTFSFVGASKVKSPYGCVTCHRIGEHGGEVGPELTHVGSRLDTKWIYAWVRDPKHWKPDVRMPNFEMPEADLLAITLYLSEQR